MATNFAKKRPVKHHQPSTSKQVVIVLISFLIGYLMATVFDFTSFCAWITTHALSYDKTHTPTKLADKSTTDIPKPTFEFYTLLAKDNHASLITNRASSSISRLSQPALVTTQISHNLQQAQALLQTPGLRVTDNKSVSLATATKEFIRDNYIIQIASFNKRRDAERLKASLVLKGFDVSIAVISANNLDWFRVTIGPFRSRSEAEKAQVDVARNEHMKGMIRKMDA
jgi:cell division protein FtsN